MIEMEKYDLERIDECARLEKVIQEISELVKNPNERTDKDDKSVANIAYADGRHYLAQEILEILNGDK